MIAIQRTSCPRSLVTGKSALAYRLKSVVRALHKMQFGKCCYCERRLPDEGHLKAVEHFRPKSVFKALANDWNNLLLACAQCNGGKSDKFPCILSDDPFEEKVIYLAAGDGRSLSPLLIDPSDDSIDPENFVSFVVDDNDLELLGLAIACDEGGRGRHTIEAVGLDSPFYTGEKYEAFFNLLWPAYGDMCLAKKMNDQMLLGQKKERYELFMSRGCQFSALARAFAREKKMDEIFGIQIPKGRQ